MGRPTKPSEIKLLEGNRGRRPIPPKVNFKQANNRTPPELTGEAAEWFKMVSAELRSLGILKAVDIPELALVARAYANAHEAARMLSKGCVLKNAETGEITVNPFEVIFRQNTRLYHDLAGNFGLNPSDRSRISAALGTDNTLDPEEQRLKESMGLK